MLVDLPNWVGDTMMALPALERLLAANADGQTVLHTRPHLKRLMEFMYPAAQAVATKRHCSPFRAARSLLSSNGRCDVGITLRNAWRAKITLALAAKQRFGSRGQGAGLLLSRAFPVDQGLHQIHDADPILRSLGLEPVELPWSRSLPDCLVTEGLTRLSSAGVAEIHRTVGLAPGSASHELKRWSSARFAELAGRVRAMGAQPLLVVGPGEADLAAEIADRAGGLQILGLELDVAGLAAVLTNLDLVVGIDSGVIHVASALGTSVVALFGPTSPERTAPLGSATTVVAAGAMYAVEVEEVERAVCRQLRLDGCHRLN